ncbi:hypothetical protein BGZ70_008377 [Mortierella alpina]|uniref:DUF676 domain-containing protein n=1 Tax=Mortierella alpina TaxID=64518 RepID=A0A9P6J3L6_MORAP|nr:hypothetical protein BGZ70_008377 [Mortierella alpina]
MAASEPTHHPDTHQGVHLVVLQNGLWGNKGHMKYIAQQFKERLGDRILVYRAESNESSLTYDGVDVCGQRLVQEVHEVIRVIEAGGNIKDLRGQKHKTKKAKKSDKKLGHPSSSVSSSPPSSNYSSKNNSQEDVLDSSIEGAKRKKVTQFSYLGYSLGGLIGRFAMGLLDMEKFFDPVDQGGRGIEPVYFVTMATPHLGIRKPPESNWSKLFNYLSSTMLSRTGEQLQLIDDYIDGKPILLVMSEPGSVFVQALSRFKRRALYCNIRNDRSVPFWTASFSDADPFSELEAMEIQYNSGYSSLIESFEHQDLETVARQQKERAEFLKAASFSERTSQRIASIPWKRYALFGILGPILIPVWIVIASTTISYQGMSSRRRTRDIITKDGPLYRIRERASTVSVERYRDDDDHDGDNHGHHSHHDRESRDNTHYTQASEVPSEQTAESPIATTTTKSSAQTKQQEQAQKAQDHSVVSITADSDSDSAEPETVVSYSYPHLKTIQPLALLPVQVEISRNLNTLEWKKNIIHIEGMNAHASIVVREKRFSNEGGVAAVQHAVDMFRDDGEDE